MACEGGFVVMCILGVGNWSLCAQCVDFLPVPYAVCLVNCCWHKSEVAITFYLHTSQETV